MKKFTLSILAVVMTAFALTSCIDNAVSPEVKAIRAAQAQLIAAQTALTNAQAQHELAVAAVQNANAAHINAETDGLEIANESALVDLELKQAAAEVTLATSALALETAQNDLQEYLDQYPNQLASELLGKYNTAAGKVYTLAGQIAAQNLVIANLELYYSTGDGAYFETVRDWRNRALADAQAELAASEAALEVILAIQADPSTTQATWAAVKSDIQDYENQILALLVDRFPFEEPLDDATDAKNDAAGVLTDAKALTAAIALSIAEYADQEADVADADDDAADALADAISESAELQAELDPFLNALVDAYATNAAYPGIVAGLEHDLRVALNEWKVATAQGNALVAQDPANDVSDAPGYDAAVSDLQDAITAIEDLTEIDTNIDVEDETSYPSFDDQYGEYTLTVTDIGAFSLADGDTYTNGGETYTIRNGGAAANATTIYVYGSVASVGVITLTKATSASGPATISVLAGTVQTYYEPNDEDDVFEEYEINDLYDGLVFGTLANPDPASDYAGASVLYNAVYPFFDGGDAWDLVDEIGRYDAWDFLDSFTDSEEANGVVAALEDYISGSGNGDNGWDESWDADAEAAYQADLLEDLEDGSSTDAVYDGESDDADRDDALTDAFDLLTDTFDETGNDVAVAEQAGAVADQASAQADYDAAKADYTAALADYDAINDQIDDLSDLQADAEDLLDVIENFIDGANSYIEDAKDRVEDAQAGFDSAEKAVADLDADVANADEQIALEQAWLDALGEELIAAQATAANWLAQLTAALGN